MMARGFAHMALALIPESSNAGQRAELKLAYTHRMILRSVRDIFFHSFLETTVFLPPSISRCTG